MEGYKLFIPSRKVYEQSDKNKIKSCCEMMNHNKHLQGMKEEEKSVF